MTEQTYTDQQATDEAVLLLVRKLRRLHPAAYADLMDRLSGTTHVIVGRADHDSA